MQRIVLKFGSISGAILAATTAVLLPLTLSGALLDFGASELIGYSAMILSFSMVFFGVRSYREERPDGAITFGKAFGVGLLISLVTCAVYVIVWEIVYYGFWPDFLDRYSAFVLEKLRSEGAGPEALAAKEAEMAKFAEYYANPIFNVAITFMEVFPVGLVVTLVSAAILRRKPPTSG